MLYIIEIAYIFALYIIIKPVFFKVLTELLRLHGYSYLTNEMMLSFFGNFDVIVILLFMFFTTGILGSILYGYMYDATEDTTKYKIGINYEPNTTEISLMSEANLEYQVYEDKNTLMNKVLYCFAKCGLIFFSKEFFTRYDI